MHIADLNAETEEPKTEHQTKITWFCSFVWGSLPQFYPIPWEEWKEKAEGGIDEKTEVLCPPLKELDRAHTGIMNGTCGYYSLRTPFSKSMYFKMILG